MDFLGLTREVLSAIFFSPLNPLIFPSSFYFSLNVSLVPSICLSNSLFDNINYICEFYYIVYALILKYETNERILLLRKWIQKRARQRKWNKIDYRIYLNNIYIYRCVKMRYSYFAFSVHDGSFILNNII